MSQSFRVLTTALVLCGVLAADARGQQLLEVDGIELRGEAQLVLSGGGTCNVLESDTSYEDKQENHGAPMDVWRLDFTVRNGSGRWLDHLIARFQIASQWPECTNWDGPDAGSFPQNIEWADSIGTIQESGRNVVAPDQTLTETRYFIVLRGDPEPRFSNWSMDFDFAAGPPTADAGSPATVPAASAEQETVFWQSIADSENPADFEAYLAQFPNGVFRALAENRLAALSAPAGDTPSRAAADNPPEVAGSRRGGGGARGDAPRAGFSADQTCAGKPEGSECFKELANQPECYVWDDYLYADQTVTWTGECAGGLAQGTGTLAWVGDDAEQSSESTGLLQDGKRHGPWVMRWSNGNVGEGPVVDGEEQGHWVIRQPNGTVGEGPVVDGNRHGNWVWSLADGRVDEVPYVDGEVHGHWVIRYANGSVEEGPMVDGERHGSWVWRNADGSTETETWVNGILQ